MSVKKRPLSEAEALVQYEEALHRIANYSDAGLNIGMSNTCGVLNGIARKAIDAVSRQHKVKGNPNE